MTDNSSFTNQPILRANSILESIFSVIQELYLYCHLKIYDKNDKDNELANINMIIVALIFLCTMIKIVTIIIYFLVVNSILSIIRFFIDIYKRRCKCVCVSELKFFCNYLVKILKKIYTYNFYSYENKPLGYFLVTVYLIFIGLNIVFAIEYRHNYTEEQDRPDYIKILQILAFEFSIFIELICGTFYLTRKVKKQILIVGPSFLFLNLVAIFAIVYKAAYLPDNDENPRRIANLVYVAHFSTLFVLSLIKVYKYDRNCNKKNILIK